MDDLISRQAAIDALRGYLVGKRCPDDGTLTCRLIENEVINKLPPIQPANCSEIPNNSDTISRAKAIDTLNEYFARIGKLKRRGLTKGEKAISLDLVGAIKTLPPAPPAQPEIIRCKDCKHWIPYDWMFSEVWRSKNMADYPEDEIGCNYCDVAMKANDFCSRGERREVTT